jgi:serine/threonine protein kinase
MKTRNRRGTKRRMKGGFVRYLRDMYTRRQKRLNLQRQRSVMQEYAVPRSKIKCQNSGECLLFGLEAEELLSFFSNFNLDMNQEEANTVITLKKLPVNSANGIVAEVKFTKTVETKVSETFSDVEQFDAFALLKTPLSLKADNLWYEYLVGLKVNPWALIFPSLTMTYGMYLNIPLAGYLKGQATRFTFKGKVVENPRDITQSCFDNNSQHLCLLTQYFEHTVPLSRHRNNSHPDLWYMYFQIYYTLYYLGKLRFIHNDLHSNNVLVVRLPKPMKFVYDMVMQDGKKFQFEFYCQHLVKIIDYGRSKVSVLTNEQMQRRKTELFEIAKNAILQNGRDKKGEEFAYVREKIRSDAVFDGFIQGGIERLAELLEEIEDSDSSAILDSLCNEEKCTKDDDLLYDYVQRAKPEYQEYLKWKSTITLDEFADFDQVENNFLTTKPYLAFVKPALTSQRKLYDVMTGDDSDAVNIIKEYYKVRGWDGYNPVITSSCGNYIGFEMANLYVKGKDFFHTERNQPLIDDKDLLQREVNKGISTRDNPLNEIFDFCYYEADKLNKARTIPTEVYGTLHVKGPTMEPMVFTKA